MGSSIYFGLMAFGSIISLLRGFVIAGLLDARVFGVYAAVVAAGAFGSNLLSLGQVENTWKEYPRLWIAGQGTRIGGLADKVARALAMRALYVAIPVAVLASVFSGRELALQALLCVGIALGVALASLYASALRAAYDLGRLGTSTLQRATYSLLFGGLGAWMAGWPGAISGEIVGAAVGALATRSSLAAAIKKNSGVAVAIGPQAGDAQEMQGGLWLFAAFLLGAAPLYLDRPFAAAIFSSGQAGTYGFVMLFATGAVTAVGIISQKLGPQLLQQERSRAAVRTQLTLALGWSLAFWLLCAFGMAVMTWLLIEGPAGIMGERYALSGTLMSVVFLLCCVQVTAIFDWILISRDRERHVFAASAVFLIAACCAGIVTFVFSLGLIEFIAAMIVAKVAHLLAQAASIGSLIAREHRQQVREC